jgi:alanine racemase
MSLSFSPGDPRLQQHWIDVDLDALKANVQVIKKLISPAGTRLMAVVKADAYGHGAAGVAGALRDAGTDTFGVTTLDEALPLLEAGIDSRTTPILLFAPLVNAEQVRIAVEAGLHLTVCDKGHLDLVRDAEAASVQAASLHLKVDTGMGRLGLRPETALDIAKLRPSWAGVYTHFARAGEKDLAATSGQLRRFLDFCEQAAGVGIDIGLRHCANSAAMLRLPESRLDMVRTGTVLYGQMPSSFVQRPEGLISETFQARAQVVFVRDVRPCETIGYGAEYVAKAPVRAAVVPIGFADGFGIAPQSIYRGWRGIKQWVGDRDPKRQPHVTIRGRRAPVLGRVAMQMIVVDVTGHNPAVAPGDIVDIPMRRLSASALLPRNYKSSS